MLTARPQGFWQKAPALKHNTFHLSLCATWQGLQHPSLPCTSRTMSRTSGLAATTVHRALHARSRVHASAEDPAGSPPASQEPLWTVPTLLTLLRVFLIPPVMWLGTMADPAAAHAACAVFVFASLTDWLDGYLARRMVRFLFGLAQLLGAGIEYKKLARS
jgi:CDP-alcohol phosphatidyltransferase